MTKSNFPSKFSIDVLEVIDNPDGTATLNLDVSDEFVAWFKEDQDLKRWSQKRFEKWVIEGLENAISKSEKENLDKETNTC